MGLRTIRTDAFGRQVVEHDTDPTTLMPRARALLAESGTTGEGAVSEVGARSVRPFTRRLRIGAEMVIVGMMVVAGIKTPNLED